MNIKKISAILLMMLLIISQSISVSLAQVETVNDDGNNSQFSQLKTNYIQITGLDFSNMDFEGDHKGYTVETGYPGINTKTALKLLIWTGKLSNGFGGTHVKNDKDAVLKFNNLPEVTMRFNNAARAAGDSESDYDVLMTLSNIKIGLTESYNEDIDDNTTIKINLATDGGSLVVVSPKTSFSKPDYDSTNKNSGAGIATKLKVTMKVVRHGTTDAISSNYPYMLITFKDLDARDRTLRKDSTPAEWWSGKYAEGVELLDGWQSPAVMAPVTEDIYNTCLVRTETTSEGNTRFSGDGELLDELIDLTNNAGPGDFNTLYSGFIAAADPQGFSFNWTGSLTGGRAANGCMGSTIAGQPTVAVWAKRTGEGAEASSLGNSSAQSGVNEWYNNIHLMNSSSVYTVTPGDGYYIKTLKVDGEEQSLSEDERFNGCDYSFERLNKYPLPERDVRNGQVFYSKESGYYTIEADFAHAVAFKDKKTSDTRYIETGSTDEITYVITSEEIYDDAPSGTHTIKDDLAGGLLHLSGSPEVNVVNGSYHINKADDTGLDIEFNSNDANGTCPKITITYKATVNWDAYYNSNETDIINTCNDNTTILTPLSELQISKKVSGNLRDTTEKFEFALSLKGLAADTEYETLTSGGGEIVSAVTGTITETGFRTDNEGNAIITLLLKDGQGASVKALPLGCKYTVTEAANDHRASYQLVTEAANPSIDKAEDHNAANWKELSTAEETLDKSDGIVTAAFINTHNTTVITGLTDHSDWMLFTGIILICITAAVMYRRRRTENDI